MSRLIQIEDFKVVIFELYQSKAARVPNKFSLIAYRLYYISSLRTIIKYIVHLSYSYDVE